MGKPSDLFGRTLFQFINRAAFQRAHSEKAF